MDKQPMFSVILPVCHGGRFLESALSSLQNVTAPADGYEVIVSGESKIARDIFDRYAKPDWSLIESQGHRSNALNEACEAARSQYWVFSDDDCVLPADWLLKIERVFVDNPGVAVIGGSDVLAQDASDFDNALDVVLNSWFATGGTRSDRSFKAGGYYPKLWNMCVRATLARQVALDGPEGRLIFDPGLQVHEDVDLIDRIEAQNGKVVYAPSVWVEHSRDTNFKAFLARNAAMAAVCRKAGIHRLPHFTMALFFAGLALLGIASIFSPWITPVLLFMAGSYLAAVVLTAICGAWWKKSLSVLMVVPVLLISLHLARTFGYVFFARIGREVHP
ncbi:MAG: glycosyltransferase [Smithella sp.]